MNKFHTIGNSEELILAIWDLLFLQKIQEALQSVVLKYFLICKDLFVFAIFYLFVNQSVCTVGIAVI